MRRAAETEEGLSHLSPLFPATTPLKSDKSNSQTAVAVPANFAAGIWGLGSDVPRKNCLNCALRYGDHSIVRVGFRVFPENQERAVGGVGRPSFEPVRQRLR